MKTLWVAIAVAVAAVSLGIPNEADARRLGGGRPAGMQRQAPPAKPADTPPPTQPGNTAQNAAAAPAAAGTAAAAGKRSWMGPIAGLAAGLGIAALMSHLGMGEAFGNLLTMLLLAAIAFIAIRWLMRRFAGGSARPATPGGMQWAGAGAGHPTPPPVPLPLQRNASELTRTDALPAGMDQGDFERIAKMIFIRMQAANDAGQVDDLRKFTTPELFASLRLDLQERGNAAQQTDVLQLDAKLLDTAAEGDQWVATVRFHGLIREEANAGAEPFDELWHLVRPRDGSRDWAIAGITPNKA